VASAPSNILFGPFFYSAARNEYQVLSWTENESGPCSYRVEVRAPGSSVWNYVTDVAKGVGFCQFGNYSKFLYDHRVTCVPSSGSSASATRALISWTRTNDQPHDLAPSIATANGSTSLLSLQWTDLSSYVYEVGVKIFRVSGSGQPIWFTRTSPGGSYALLRSNVFLDGSLANGASSNYAATWNIKDAAVAIGAGSPDSLRDGDLVRVEIQTWSGVSSSQGPEPVVTTGLLFTYHAPISLTTSQLLVATKDQPYSVNFAAGAIGTPVSWAISSTPTGLSFNTGTGVLNGTPTVQGTFGFDISVTNGAGQVTTQHFTLQVNPVAIPVISAPATAALNVGVAASVQLVASNNPTSYAIVSGTLPAGLSLDTSTGIISGTPTTAGTPTVVFKATNSGGDSANWSLAFTVTAIAVPVVTSATTASGYSGDPFGYQITASNSPTAYSAAGLPAGLSLDSTTGFISGTLTSTGTFFITLRASNAGGIGAAVTLTLTVSNRIPTVTGGSASATQGQTFGYQIHAANSPTFFSATGLPNGVYCNSTSGFIFGTPSESGTFTVTLSARNSAGTGTATLTLTVAAPAVSPPVISSPTTASGKAGRAFNYQITASNSPTSFDAQNLPAGVSVDPVYGLITGVPTVSGTFYVTLTASNSGGSGTATLTITLAAALLPPVITSSATVSGRIGRAFTTYQIAASNTPTSFGASSLPAGLAVDTSTGRITGTPSGIPGTFVAVITATNAAGTGEAELTITLAAAVVPPAITSAATASAKVGRAFSYQIGATNSPASYAASGLPGGLTVSTTTGRISGTPTANGTFDVTISATNTGGTGDATLTITVAPAAIAPVITSNTTDAAPAVTGSNFSYQITASNVPTSFGATGLPAGLTVNTTTGLISGKPTVAGTYSATISATNTAGTGYDTLEIVVTSAIAAPVISISGAVPGVVGVAFSYQIAATNSPTSYGATPLPAGLSLNATTGVISGTPTAAATTSVALTATNSGGTGAATLSIVIAASAPVTPPPVISSANSISTAVGTAIDFQITATHSPTSFAATGLPADLTLDSATGRITGTPGTADTYIVTLSATNAGGAGYGSLLIDVQAIEGDGDIPVRATSCKFWVDTVAKRLVSGFNSSTPADTYRFFQGDTPSVDIVFLEPTGDVFAPYKVKKYIGAAVRVGVGKPAVPTSGTFPLKDAAQSTAAIACNASAAAVQSAVRAGLTTRWSAAVVTGPDGGPWRIDRGVTGSAPALTADPANLVPDSEVLIKVRRDGSSTQNALQTVSLQQLSAAYSDTWTPFAQHRGFTGELSFDTEGVDQMIGAAAEVTDAIIEIEVTRAGCKPETLVHETCTVINDLLENGIYGATPNPNAVTADQDIVATPANTGTVTQLFSWIAKLIKGITGKSDWKTAPAITLEAAKTQLDAKALAADLLSTFRSDINGPSSLAAVPTVDLHGWTNDANDGRPVMFTYHNGDDDGTIDTYLLVSDAYTDFSAQQPTQAVQPADFDATTNAKHWALISRFDDGGAIGFGSVMMPEGSLLVVNEIVFNVAGLLALNGSVLGTVSFVASAFNLGGGARSAFYSGSTSVDWRMPNLSDVAIGYEIIVGHDGSAGTLTVKNNAGTSTLATMAAGETSLFISRGATWKRIKFAT
jgi:hypothetical protein